MFQRRLATVLTTALLFPLFGCVSKGTHNVALSDLAGVRGEREELLAEIVRRDSLESELRGDLERSARERAALERELRDEIAELEEIQRQTRAELRRLETALGERGAEYRALQEQLVSLSAIQREIRDRNRIYEDVIGRFQSLIDAGQLSVDIVRGRLVIQLPQDILFESGSAVVGREGRETLATVGTVLAELTDRKFQIEGHTDNVPIATARFPSNWELSSGRALSVVRILVEQGVVPANLSGAGYGEFQPVASNDDRESRRANRRIEIVMLPNLDVIATTRAPE